MTIELTAHSFTATGGATARNLPDWMAVVEAPRNDTVKTGFWSDVDASPPRIHRMRDRVFVGNGALMHGNVVGNNNTFLASNAVGAAWAPIGAQLLVMSDVGCLAIVGASRSSDETTPTTNIAVGGFSIIDKAGRTGRALYADIQFELGNYAYGLEVAAKNKSAVDSTASPYNAETGVYGAYLVAGGDPSYGGAAVNPPNTAIYIFPGDSLNYGSISAPYKWNKGIVFDRYALKGADGSGDSNQRDASAMEMAVGQNIRWRAPGAVISAQILSSALSNPVTQIFQAGVVNWYGANGATLLTIQHVTNAVNGLFISNNVAASSPAITAAGTDTDIDIRLVPKGAGNVRFGVLTASGDVAVSGYITVKDAGGVARKLAVIT